MQFSMRFSTSAAQTLEVNKTRAIIIHAFACVRPIQVEFTSPVMTTL